jgi:hypothetical protein
MFHFASVSIYISQVTNSFYGILCKFKSLLASKGKNNCEFKIKKIKACARRLIVWKFYFHAFYTARLENVK